MFHLKKRSLKKTGGNDELSYSHLLKKDHRVFKKLFSWTPMKISYDQRQLGNHLADIVTMKFRDPEFTAWISNRVGFSSLGPQQITHKPQLVTRGPKKRSPQNLAWCPVMHALHWGCLTPVIFGSQGNCWEFWEKSELMILKVITSLELSHWNYWVRMRPVRSLGKKTTNPQIWTPFWCRRNPPSSAPS